MPSEVTYYAILDNDHAALALLILNNARAHPTQAPELAPDPDSELALEHPAWGPAAALCRHQAPSSILDRRGPNSHQQ